MSWFVAVYGSAILDFSGSCALQCCFGSNPGVAVQRHYAYIRSVPSQYELCIISMREKQFHSDFDRGTLVD
jgi:hypothetical protein